MKITLLTDIFPGQLSSAKRGVISCWKLLSFLPLFMKTQWMKWIETNDFELSDLAKQTNLIFQCGQP